VSFFDFLFSKRFPKNCEVAADKIWLTADAKFAGISKDVAKRSNKQPAAILLVAHFPDTLARLQELVANSTAVPTTAALATNLMPDLAAGLQLGPSTTIDLIVAERHPLASADAHVQNFAASLPCRCRIGHHLALDDPLVHAFAGEWVRNLLGKMGMKENESIESTLITRRIKGAQKQIESQSRGCDLPARSAAEWLERNCPNVERT
jgi:hypothetical protein